MTLSVPMLCGMRRKRRKQISEIRKRKKSLAYKKLEWSKRLILMPILRLPLLSGTSIIGTRRLRMEANETGELVTV